MNLIESNKSRAILIASICAARLGARAGQWQGYTADEGIEGVLVQDGLLRYNRPGKGNDPNYGLLFFQEPKLTELDKVDWGDYHVVQKDVVEHETQTITKIKGIDYKNTIEHTFTKTTSMSEAFKVGAELAVKTYFEGSYAGIKGGAEVSAKLTAEYSRQWGTEETHSDTVRREIELPIDFGGEVNVDVVRSIDKMERHVKGIFDLDYHINFVSAPPQPYPDNRPMFDLGWDSVQQFIDVGTGQAAADKAMYGEFMAQPLKDDEVEQIKELGKQTIEITLQYDNVTRQEIVIK